MQKDSKRQHAAAAVDEARRGPENERKVCVVSSAGVCKRKKEEAQKKTPTSDLQIIEKALVQYIPVEHSYLYG